MDGPARQAISGRDAQAVIEALAPAGLGALVVGSDGVVVSANQAAGRLLGVAVRPGAALARLDARLQAQRPDGSAWALGGLIGPDGLRAEDHVDGLLIGLRRDGGTVEWLSVTTRVVVGPGVERSMLLVLGRLSGLDVPGVTDAPGAPRLPVSDEAAGSLEAGSGTAFDGAAIGTAVVDRHGRIAPATPEPLRRPGKADRARSTKRPPEQVDAKPAEAHHFETLGRLAGGVAHDFNNLLGVISNYATFLARSPALPPSLAGDVAQISHAVQRGADLTRQLLLFSRREQLRPQRIDLAELIESLAALVSRPLKPVVTLEVAVEEDIAVHADRGQIEQMLLNLLLNARDAIASAREAEPSRGPGRLELRASSVDLGTGDPRLGHLAVGRYALLTVVDDGPGMSAETLAHAFQPFFTTRNRPDASGLGLATVEGIAERSGGRVWIDSVLGDGTTVSVLLPLVRATPADG